MKNSKRTVWFAGTAGWFECDPTEGLVRVELHDERVVEAKKRGQKFLIGSDLAAFVDPAQAAENDRKKRQFETMRDRCAQFQRDAEENAKRTATAISEREKAEAEARDANAALAVAQNAKVEAERNLGIRTGEATAAQAEAATLRDELTKEKAARVAAESRVGGADPAEVTRLTNELAAAKAEIAALKKELDDAKKASAPGPAPAAPKAAKMPAYYERHPGWAWGGGGAVALFLLLLLFGSYSYWFTSPSAEIVTLRTSLGDCQTESAKKDDVIKQKDDLIAQKDEIIKTKIAEASPPKPEPSKADDTPKDDSKSMETPAPKGDAEKEVAPPSGPVAEAAPLPVLPPRPQSLCEKYGGHLRLGVCVPN